MLVQNIRSIKNKMGILRACANELRLFDVVAWTETWLNDHVDSEELASSLPQHMWFRRDRPTHAGGVACAISLHLQPERREDLEPPAAEMLVVDIQTANVILAIVYCPPDGNSIPEVFRVCQDLRTRHPNKTVVVAGDFNVPEVRWTSVGGDSGATPYIQRSAPRALQLLDGISTAGLVQHVGQPTRGNSYLDLVLSNGACVNATVCEGIFPSDHAEVRCTLRIKKRGKRFSTRPTVFDYKRADFNGLRRSLNLVDWTQLNTLPVNDAVKMFYAHLHRSITSHIPTVTLKRHYPPWFDADVRKALTDKEYAFRALKRDRNVDTLAYFRDCRRVFKKVSCMKYFEYLKSMTADFKQNPKRFWSFLKCIKGGKGQLPTLLDNAVEVSGDVERANLLNRTFAAKFSDPAIDCLPAAFDFDLPELLTSDVSASSVSSIIGSLNIHKATGPDDVSARVIRECADQLVSPLTIICMLSVEQGTFPEKWKEANIVPVFKKGSRRLPSNYRAVSITSFFGKLLEKVVRDALFTHVQSVLSECQHGFIPGRSCETNLACLLSTACDSLDNGKQTDIIYTDFSSAFQSVSHQLLI